MSGPPSSVSGLETQSEERSIRDQGELVRELPVMLQLVLKSSKSRRDLLAFLRLLLVGDFEHGASDVVDGSSLGVVVSGKFCDRIVIAAIPGSQASVLSLRQSQRSDCPPCLTGLFQVSILIFQISFWGSCLLTNFRIVFHLDKRGPTPAQQWETDSTRNFSRME